MRLIQFSLFIAVVTSFCTPAAAQLSQYKTYGPAYYKGMRYGLFKPENYSASKSYPLIVYLHGAGDTVSRDNAWYHAEIQRKDPCFVLSPKTEIRDQGWGNSWQKEHTPVMEKTLALVDSLISRYNIDRNRLYIYGISMGGFGVFSVLSKNPEKFAGAYAICGGSSVDVADQIKTPLWIFHGSDDDIVPVLLSRDIYNAMVSGKGRSVRYTEYPGVKHNSWENVSREKSLHTWLLSQRKENANLNAPPAVTGLRILSEKGKIKLVWNKSRNSDSLWYYRIFRDDVLYAEANNDAVSYTDNDNGGNSHVYYVTAVGYTFVESPPSHKVKF